MPKDFNDIIKSLRGEEISKKEKMSIIDKNIDIIKSQLDVTKLVKKIVTVKGPKGVYQAIRYVNPDTDQPVENPKVPTKLQGVLHDKHNLEDQVDAIINSKSFTLSDKTRSLIHLGFLNAQDLMVMTGEVAPSKFGWAFKELGLDYKEYLDTGSTPKAVGGKQVVETTEDGKRKSIEQLREEGVKEDEIFKIIKKRKEERAKEWGITVDDKWDAYALQLDMLFQLGRPKSLLAYGTGGVGKTYQLFDQAIPGNNIRMYDDELDMTTEEYDAVKITGSVAMRDFWRLVVKNKDKIMIFDDCDNMWDNDSMANVLKGMLDSTGDGTVRYGQASKDEDGEQLPRQIKFTGKVIFISNLTRKDFVDRDMSPIVDSRASAIDLSMTMEQTLEKLDKIKYKMRFENDKGEPLDVSKDIREKCVQFLKDHKDDLRIEQVNGRTLGRLALLAYFVNNNPNVNDKEKLFRKQAAINLDLV